MKFCSTRAAAMGMILGLSTLVSIPGQAVDTGSERAVVSRVEPAYPEIAKKAGIAGAVRLEVQVSAGGQVRQVKVLGGNPLLVQSAENAVRRWKFASAPQESTVVVVINFIR